MDRFFYAPPESFSDTGDVILPPDEARHAIKALRLRPEDIVTVVDGQGLAAKVQIVRADRNEVLGRVISIDQNLGEPSWTLTIGLALLNQHRRYELFLEKAVELGVTQIIPLTTDRTQSKIWREDRAVQVMIAALKQCHRSKLPILHPVTSFRDAVHEGILIADPNADQPILQEIHTAGDSVTFLIGPEGGWTDQELQCARKHGGKLVRLGPRSLRAETAAICCAASMMLNNPYK